MYFFASFLVKPATLPGLSWRQMSAIGSETGNGDKLCINETNGGITAIPIYVTRSTAKQIPCLEL
jgi:hypothetical protein